MSHPPGVPEFRYPRSWRANVIPFAHPLTQPYGLPISPLVLAYAAAALVLAVAFAVPRGERRSPEGDIGEVTSWAGSLSAPQVATRAGAVALLVLAIAAGRVGEDDELENLAPALVVGAGWPLLVVASLALGAVWRWVDPWDAIARVLARGDDDRPPPDHVYPAAVVALAWVWYLSVYADTLAPRSVGAALALYTLVTVAGCLAFGRRRWLATAEPFGILLSWTALLRRGRLADWAPPKAAELLLGVLAGGVLFGAVRRSELWGDLNTKSNADLLAVVGLVASCAAVGALLAAMAAAAKRPASLAVARAAVPVVVAAIVAVAMDRNRLTTSVQLLPAQLGDPFGRGWDAFGRAGAGLDPAPLGIRGLIVAQLAVLLAGFLAGAVVLARRGGRRTRTPIAAGLSLFAGAAVIALASH